ncbi:L-rhamnose mutarotase [Dyadobacter sandarakinus]|uniref:L-rhamnose mutarotase n=1 Tax=Dyadobacter sandarakinus TaxID=2747268 RepID=A0ABX7IDN8_9BACT|nr:L-rhamnose mutarotase [Dyadobacter sandarakinus]QRR03923.1 L-rhamnose mutarotase [Dyadobacter sandarakinus]
MKRYCMAVDLVDDPVMIAEYESYHKQIRPEIEKSILDAGVTQMEIFRVGNRLFMIMETVDDFSFESKAQMDASNPKVQEWEQLMWKYQRALPVSRPGEKWVLMDQIFALR